MWISSVLFFCAFFVILLPLLRKNLLARFWCIGMTLSTLPFCATVPSSRNVLFVGIGAFGLIVLFAGGVLSKENWMLKSVPWRVSAWALCIILFLVHVPMAAAMRFLMSTTAGTVFSHALGFTTNVGTPEGIENQDLIIVNGPGSLGLIVLPFANAYEGNAPPRAIRALSPGLSAFEVLRTDEKTLLLRTRSGNLFSCYEKSPLHFVHLYATFHTLFRSDRSHFQEGQKIVLPRLTVEVITVDDQGLPSEVSFNFSAPLDDRSMRWLQFNWGEFFYSKFEIPAVGETMELGGPIPVSFGDAMQYIRRVFLCH
jgi:hypothetical protein